jgi:peptidoglycan/LPS O-acetylase OafA/YrhL
MGRTLSSKGRRAAVGGGLLAALALLFAAAESNTGMLPVFALLGHVLSVPAGALLGYAAADIGGVGDRRPVRMACSVAVGSLVLAASLALAFRQLGLSFADYDPLIYLLWFDLVVAAVAVGEAGALAAERLRTALST